MPSLTSLLGRTTLAASALSLSMGAHALGLTLDLPTTNLDAMTSYTFAAPTQNVMNRLGLSVQALGNAKQQPGNAWVFDMPVTDVTVTTSLLGLSITPKYGEASGSALGISSDEGSLVLANFSIDFGRKILSADLTTTAGTVKGFDVYSFNVAEGLHVSMAGGLSMQMSLDHMTLTSGAQSTFAQALALPSVAVAVLGALDFGAMAINVSPALRFGVSDKAFVTTLATIPEPRPIALMLLGLVGMAFVARRKC
jgi:hypothetical protein